MPGKKLVRTVLSALLISFLVLGTFPAAFAGKVNTGKLIEEDGTVMLLSGKGKFVLEGADFSEYLGETARIEGKVETRDGVRIIQVQKSRIIKLKPTN